MAERTNSECKIEHNKFNLRIGTTNRKNPLVVYVEGKTFISPNVEKESYGNDIYIIKKSLRESIAKNVKNNKHFEDNIIFDFQVAQNGISVGKKSFLTFQFLIKQKQNEVSVKIKEIREKSLPLVMSVISDLDNTISKNNFSIFKSKKS